MSLHDPMTIRLESFEGPLDLLLYFIQTHALDISKVSIEKITDQYLAYVQKIQELHFDTASEFLVMAATLLYWKSRSLLPKESIDKKNSEITQPLTQEDLIQQLREHQRFLEVGESLKQLPHLGIDFFMREGIKPPIEKIWKEASLSDLSLTYQSLLIRSRKRTQILKKETVSIRDKIKELLGFLSLYQLIEFKTLMPSIPTRPEKVATFLATLELGKLKKMKLFQEKVYASIYVQLIETFEDFEKTLIYEL
jgi:segregation and condensation protein A